MLLRAIGFKQAVLVAVAALALCAAGTAQADDGAAAGDPVLSPAFEGTGITVPPSDATVSTRVPPPVGEVGIESIIGLDKRTQVVNTLAFPARATALVTFTGGSCTGFMIGKDTVATAGHCVFNNGAWSTNVRVFPGRNGAQAPFGWCTARGNSQPGAGLFTNANWLLTGDERFDYGAINLNCAIGNATGWYGLLDRPNLAGMQEHILGYPGDKPAGTQWLSNDCSNNFLFLQCAVAGQTAEQLFYSNDTFAGNSGGPVYVTNVPGCPCAIGIHAYGLHGGAPHNLFNHGTRTRWNVIQFFWSVRDRP